MRRTEHEKDRDFGLKVIDKCIYMVLSMTAPGGEPYCVPLSPAREGNHLYFHCATEGRKLNALRAHPKVAMAFVGDVEVSSQAYTTYYECALADGTAAEVTDEAERLAALRLLCQKYSAAHMDKFDRVMRTSAPHTGVWRIELDSITAKGNLL